MTRSPSKQAGLFVFPKLAAIVSRPAVNLAFSGLLAPRALTASPRRRNLGAGQRAIAVPTLAFNFTGDGVCDAADPRQLSAARGATDT